MSPFDQAPPDPSAPTAEDQTDQEIDPEGYSDAEAVAEALSRYWGNFDEKELYDVLRAKENECYDAYDRRGLISIDRLAFAQYFGLSNSSNGGSGGGQWECQSVMFEGENGEQMSVSINEFRSFCDQIFSMTTANRPSFEAQAVNTDADSLAQVEASDSLLEYTYEGVYGERKEKEVVRFEGLYGKGWTHIEWDEDGGPDVEIPAEADHPAGPIPTTQKVKAGEFIITSLKPWEVIHEPYRSEYTKHLWRVVIDSSRSRWELIARYPIKADDLMKVGFEGNPRAYSFPGADPSMKEDADTVTVRTFYHAKCGAVPQGRKVIFAGNVMVADDPLPIDDIPLIDLMSCELHGTSFGVSDLWNLIPLSQLKAQIMSDIATNVEAFGRPPLVLEEGQDIDLDALANGQKVIFKPVGADSPEPMKFPAIPDTSFKVLELLRTLEQSVSGLNSVFRGEPQANVTSGSMAALFDNRAIENQSPRQDALDLMRERIGNVLLQYLKSYALHPQLVAIVGKDERGYLESFTKEDLAGVHRVVVKTASPMLRSQAGRMQLADTLRQWPGSPLSDPSQIIQLITTGQFKPMYSLTRATQLHIRAENEALMLGPAIQAVPQPPDPMTGMPAPPKNVVSTVAALATENAHDHIVGHLEILYSPAAQKNPAIKQAALTHILDHIDVARNNDPYTCTLLGLPPPQQLAPDPNAPQQDQEPQGPGQGVGGGGQTKPNPLSTGDNTDDSNGASLPKPANAPKTAMNQPV